MKDISGYCALWRNILGTGHPDDLSSQEHEAFRNHLGSCSDCRATLAASEEGIVLLMDEALLPKGSLPSWDEIVRRHTKERVLSFPEPIDLKEGSTEALLPKGSLLGWDEIVIKHAREQAVSFSEPSYSQEVSMALARTIAPSAILERIFDIQEVKATRILKEKAEQFIEAWPLLSEVVGGRSLRVGKGG